MFSVVSVTVFCFSRANCFVKKNKKTKKKKTTLTLCSKQSFCFITVDWHNSHHKSVLCRNNLDKTSNIKNKQDGDIWNLPVSLQQLAEPWFLVTSGRSSREASRTCTTSWSTRRSRFTRQPSPSTATRHSWSHTTANPCSPRWAALTNRPSVHKRIFWQKTVLSEERNSKGIDESWQRAIFVCCLARTTRVICTTPLNFLFTFENVLRFFPRLYGCCGKGLISLTKKDQICELC